MAFKNKKSGFILLVARSTKTMTNETDGFFCQARRRPAAVWGIRQGDATTHGGKRRRFMSSFWWNGLLVLLAFSASIAVMQPVSAQTTERQAQVITAARMRAGAGENERILGVLYQGEVIRVLQQDGEWSKIRLVRRAVPVRSGGVRSGGRASCLLRSVRGFFAVRGRVILPQQAGETVGGIDGIGDGGGRVAIADHVC